MENALSWNALGQALVLAGGSITQLGLPIDPSMLLLLGRLGQIPVLSYSNVLKSSDRNALDVILPRLLAGDNLSCTDLAALGHGGLLIQP